MNAVSMWEIRSTKFVLEVYMAFFRWLPLSLIDRRQIATSSVNGRRQDGWEADIQSVITSSPFLAASSNAAWQLIILATR